MQSNYDQYVMGQTMGKFGVISVHLWVEHLLSSCLRVVLPDPEPVFRDRSMCFPLLVSMCEAHRVIDAPLATALRKLNSLRNKCAHQLAFQPSNSDLAAFTEQLTQIEPAAKLTGDEYPLRRVAELLEQRAIAIGAVTQ